MRSERGNVSGSCEEADVLRTQNPDAKNGVQSQEREKLIREYHAKLQALQIEFGIKAIALELEYNRKQHQTRDPDIFNTTIVTSTTKQSGFNLFQPVSQKPVLNHNSETRKTHTML